MDWQPDFLMRRFLGEHLDTAQEEQDQGSEPNRDLQNPNLSDLPEQAASSGTGSTGVANVFWSEWANDEHRLRQMRPDHLPPASEGHVDAFGRSSEQTTDENPGSYGTDVLFWTAREMDRQTSIARFQPLEALQFLNETMDSGSREPEYFNMAAGDDVSSEANRGTASDGQVAKAGNQTGSSSVRPVVGYERDDFGSGMEQRAEDLRGVLSGGRLGESRAPLAESSQGFPNAQQSAVASRTAEREAAPLASGNMSVMEIKERLSRGEADHQMVASLLQRLEEAERRTRSSASLHSAVESLPPRVHSRQSVERVHSRQLVEGVHSRQLVEGVHSRQLVEGVHSRQLAEGVHSRQLSEQALRP